MAAGVPTHRQFLTSLIDSLTSIPVPAPSSSPPAPNVEGNPLKLVPPACRPLFTTLYALYPLILLPALDLLDRRLAAHVSVRPQQQDTTAQTETGARPGPQLGPACDNDKEGNKEESGVATGSYSSASGNRCSSSNSYYVVRSAQPQQTRRHGWGSNASPSGPSYIVRLDAWNCTCAAFAFAAFPREDNQQHSYVIEPSSSTSRKRGVKEERVEGQSEKWEFGALSVDGREGSGIAGVPCCKHLLACLLAERWNGLLGGYVEERIVGREESVGLVADI
ncbi:hypothetical protein F4820DRAFT_416969 [Hypoxylon rubiginosum]|uniref:Uncharacterized protein n=1 Tax=Hypoxylon rubiginosum TaxID=110542 RepID=A0ACB9Z582_9PEZI|nr:hypothetical protein F4820DRAFT_416969 [Hypoxylon rubiginosum]